MIDSLAGLQWVAKHSNGNGPEPWNNEYAGYSSRWECWGHTAHYAAGFAGVAITRLQIVHLLQTRAFGVQVSTPRQPFMHKSQILSDGTAYIDCSSNLV
jgi:hypothetical protein